MPAIYTLTKQQSSTAKMYVGTKAVNKMYLDSKEVKKAYMGDKLVYEQQSSSGETWVLNQQISPAFEPTSSSINFTSNNESFVFFDVDAINSGYLRYSYDPSNSIEIYKFSDGTWLRGSEYRTITFETPPTGDLLTWLTANGTKQ